MNQFSSFLGKVLVFLTYKKDVYLFERSKQYITSWGQGTYGYPVVSCYDGVSKLSVGAYTSIASNVSILLGANHRTGITTYPRSLINSKVSQAETNRPGNVTIGNDVWICHGVTIVGEVTIGDGAIIGAGSLVIEDVEPYAVVRGVPAQVVKYRFDKSDINSLLDIAWWSFPQEKIRSMEMDLYTGDVKTFIDRYKK